MDFSHSWEINWQDRGENSLKKKKKHLIILHYMGPQKTLELHLKPKWKNCPITLTYSSGYMRVLPAGEKNNTQDAANKNPLSRSHYTLQLYPTWLHYIAFIRDTVRNSRVCHRCYRTSAKDPDCAGLCVFVRVDLLRSARQDRAAVCSLLLSGKVWQARTATLWTPFSTRML